MEWVKGGVIGIGSFGPVSLGVTVTGANNYRIMAVKSASGSRTSILRKEKQILDDLSGCQHIVNCIGDEEVAGEDQVYNLFLDYAPGGSLADHMIRSGGRLPETEVRHITRSVLRALCFIHAKGYVHCDIKLQNILLYSSMHAKVADFGLAKRSGEKAEFRGTPLYMAPESVARGEYEAPADVWSLGCTVFEMIVGRPAWSLISDALNIPGLLFRIGFCDDLPELPSEISDEASDFLAKCFVRDPEMRWTAEMLAGHPFLAGDVGTPVHSKKLFESPRSTLDFHELSSQTGFSLLPQESVTDEDIKQLGQCNLRPEERIRQLATKLPQPNWCSSCEDGWISARGPTSPALKFEETHVDVQKFEQSFPQMIVDDNRESTCDLRLQVPAQSRISRSPINVQYPRLFDQEAALSSACFSATIHNDLPEITDRICSRNPGPTYKCMKNTGVSVVERNLNRVYTDKCIVSNKCEIDSEYFY